MIGRWQKDYLKAITGGRDWFSLAFGELDPAYRDSFCALFFFPKGTPCLFSSFSFTDKFLLKEGKKNKTRLPAKLNVPVVLKT